MPNAWATSDHLTLFHPTSGQQEISILALLLTSCFRRVAGFQVTALSLMSQPVTFLDHRVLGGGGGGRGQASLRSYLECVHTSQALLPRLIHAAGPLLRPL